MDVVSVGSQKSVPASEDVFDEDLQLEPIFETFMCPLTKQVMKDPVTLENGQTFEREAIEKWFEECESNGRDPVCPLTMKKLRNTDVTSNVALQRTILEWNLRNELSRLKIARSSISSDSPVSETLKVMNHVENLHNKGAPYRNVIRKANIIPTITSMLSNSSGNVRCRSLEVLCTLAEDDKNKESVANGGNLRTIVKFLYHGVSQEKELALRLLYELSKSESVSRRIGEINGAILMLIGITSSVTETASITQNAERTLENLEQCENNVMQMADNGRLQPLLRFFMKGSPETQISMASHLGNLVLSDETKISVARTAGPSFVKLMSSEDMAAKETALKALNAISSYELSAMSLLESGILPPLVADLFATGNKQLPLRLKLLSATILANLVASGAEIDSIALNNDSRTLISEDVIHSLLHLISNAHPAVGCKLLQVLVGLTSSPATVQHVVGAIKKSGATTSLVQFMDVEDPGIRLEAIKVLHNVSPFMRSGLSKSLCGSSGLGKLIQIASENYEISEEQAFAISVLAELPEDDPDLALCFLQDPAFGVLLAKLLEIHRGRVLGSRQSIRYFEGLTQVIAKLTFSLDYPQALVFAIDNELAVIFADLLGTNGLDNVQMLSAKALGNLSRHTGRLSRVPERPKAGCFGALSPCFTSNTKKPAAADLCKVHGGVCSLKETFCLVGGAVVDRLVSCLGHANESVVQAALAALSTLLEDGLSVENGTSALVDARAVGPIIQILIGKRADPTHRMAIWAMERLLRTESVALEAFGNANVRPVLIDAYQNGDIRTKQIAEDALKWIDILPNFSRIF